MTHKLQAARLMNCCSMQNESILCGTHNPMTGYGDREACGEENNMKMRNNGRPHVPLLSTSTVISPVPQRTSSKIPSYFVLRFVCR